MLLAEEVLNLEQFVGWIGCACLGTRDHASKSYKDEIDLSNLKATFALKNIMCDENNTISELFSCYLKTQTYQSIISSISIELFSIFTVSTINLSLIHI